MAEGRDIFAQGVVVRLFRAWSAQVEAGHAPMTRLQEIVAPLGLPDETAIACASLFQLVEGHLGRRLVRESCCSRRLSPDESALLGVLRVAPSLSAVAGTAAVPHGLPGAIVWAVIAVRQALGMAQPDDGAGGSAPGPVPACPFAPRTHRAEAFHGF
ncbi:hypothetical protein [Pelagerythrobacter rhizovicinus]|uniref:Uncharacterized protein n=1 Tax=Pelagerythrobacter rhizovicinus TaxID=2268576 RepID=A0A4Q2KLY0_9SPHN|nr:hypothetical protein [Pelagerythrobacter rhizovicinus]RXZ64383.1 hypothetical protein ETX26_10815 [Pelagerythrobacter rhizovicinus]